MTDLVERLRRLLKTCDREWFCFPLVEEAATALEAKDKELAALRDERDTWRTQAKYETDVAQAAVDHIKELEARAEAAERERDMLGEVIEDTARELGCENDNEAILIAIDRLRRERNEAREALKTFAALGRWLTSKIPDDEVVYRVSTATVTAGDLRRAVRSCFWRLTQ